MNQLQIFHFKENQVRTIEKRTRTKGGDINANHDHKRSS
jgi:hypothetical protein